jgi:hypothetical protein
VNSGALPIRTEFVQNGRRDHHQGQGEHHGMLGLAAKHLDPDGRMATTGSK